MKLTITKCVVVATISVFLMVGASTTAWAQCPASPSYTPDFSSNPGCMALNADSMFVLSSGSNLLQLTSSAGNQIGSTWFSTPQTVENGFTTSFQFQFTNPSTPPADGIAFVIQNSSTETTKAIGFTGGNGGAIGYGDDDSNADPSTGEGIPNSLAIEFDTYQNGWDPAGNGNGSDSHVAIQSCGMGRNTSHHNYQCVPGGPNSTVGAPVVTATNMADGNVHSVTITYTAACSTCSPSTSANLQVMLDGVDVFASPVTVDLSTIGLGAGGTAYVGFTGATGGDFETQDILNWTFAPTQQGQTINPTTPGSLTQSFTINNTSGQVWDFGFDYAPASTAGTITVQPGTTPFVSSAVVTPSVWASITKGTQMADANCLLAAGAGQAVCAVNTLACTTTANSTPQGSNCPSSSTRNVLFTQEIDLAQNQPAITVTDGVPYLNIPAGYAPGLAMAPDVIVPGGQCAYPNAPLSAQLCPQNIMTVLEDGTPKGGGTAPLPNSTYVLFCCEPERATTGTIPAWSNLSGGGVPVSFNSAPPPTPNPDPNNFQAAQGAFVVVGAELPSLDPVDTTYPVPGEESLNANNRMPIPSCPALGASPTPWSTQASAAFAVNGVITDYYTGNPMSPTAPLTDGAYSAHYFSVDCDNFEELVYQASINVTPGQPTANVIRFKTAPFNVDTTAPTVTYSLSAAGPYPLNSALSATFTCTDTVNGGVASGIATCAGQANPSVQSYPPATSAPTFTTTPVPLSTAAAGPQMFNTVSTDQAGNQTATSISYSVLAAPLTIMASSAIINYGQPVPAITASYSGLLSGDNLTASPSCSVTIPMGNPVGTYTTTCIGAVGPNYSITYGSGTLTIKPVPLTITASSATMTYGGTVPTITPSYNGFVNGDTAASLSSAPVCTTTATSASLPGTYASSCSGAVDSNYTIGYTAGTVTVVGLDISPLTVNFGQLYQGQVGLQAITLTNKGTTPITISNISFSGAGTAPGDYGDLSLCTPLITKMPGTLPAGKSCVILVGILASANVFSPTASTSTLTITDSAASQTVLLTAQVINPKATLSASSLSFSAAGQQLVTLTNTGNTPLTLNTVTSSGSSTFSLSGTTCTNGLQIAAGGKCTIDVTFTPTSSSSVSGKVTITDNALNSPQTISLSGK